MENIDLQKYLNEQINLDKLELNNNTTINKTENNKITITGEYILRIDRPDLLEPGLNELMLKLLVDLKNRLNKRLKL